MDEVDVFNILGITLKPKPKPKKKPGKITDIVNAQIYMHDGMPDERELQVEVYRERCNGVTSVVTITQEELIEYLNKREGIDA